MKLARRAVNIPRAAVIARRAIFLFESERMLRLGEATYVSGDFLPGRKVVLLQDCFGAKEKFFFS
jgi:hypothetical protein